jgi:hypothetical protein
MRLGGQCAVKATQTRHQAAMDFKNGCDVHCRREAVV